MPERTNPGNVGSSSNAMGDMGLATLLSLAGAAIGGWIGWLLGSTVSFFVAFLVSVVGTGVGMYYGRVLARRWS